MSEKRNEELNSKNIENLLKEEIDRTVNQNLHLIEGLEQKVIGRLEKKEDTTSIISKLFEPFSHLLNRKIAYGLTGIALIIMGVFIGMAIQGGLGAPEFTTDRGPGVWFIVAYPEAKQVSVVGDFTDWEPKSLKKEERGVWAVKLDLEPGRYEYNFVINERRWILDPRADEYAKSFGDYNSVIYVKREST